MTKREIAKLNALEQQNKRDSLRALLELSQGYNAKPEQILEISIKFGVPPDVLEEMYFDEMEEAMSEDRA